MIVMSKMLSRDMKYTVPVGCQNRAWNMDYRLSGRLDLLQPSHSTLWSGELGLSKESQPRRSIFFKKYRSEPKGILPYKTNHLRLTSVATLSLCFVSQRNSRTRVYNGGLLDDKTITVKTRNVSTRIGKGNFVDFIGVQPNLALTAFQDGGCETLLKLQRNYHKEQKNNEKLRTTKDEEETNHETSYKWPDKNIQNGDRENGHFQGNSSG